jgi:integrase
VPKRSDEKVQRDNDGLHKRRGIWYYTLTIDGQRRFFSTQTRNYTEARTARAKAVRDQQENRLPTDLAKWQFDKLLAQVTSERELYLAENSRRIERERSGPLVKYFGGRRVCEIDNNAIRAYQLARSKQVSPRTINLECKVLRHVLKAARTWGNLADGYKSLKEDRRGPGRALEPEQEKILLETAQGNQAWDAAFFAALVASNTTMRGCELKGLQLRDFDLVDKQITIRRSKTNAGERAIPLNGAALWAFARLLERANALGSTEPEHCLFPAFRYRKTKEAPASRGTGYDPLRPQKTWRTAWRSLVKETAIRAGAKAVEAALKAGGDAEMAEAARGKAAGAFAGLRFHDLRHSAITKLAESGASDSTIMAIAGHLDRSMMEHYSHIRGAAKRAAVDSIASTFNPETALRVDTPTTVQ